MVDVPESCPLTEATYTQEVDYGQYLESKREAIGVIAEALRNIEETT
jgi:hypothetical protein